MKEGKVSSAIEPPSAVAAAQQRRHGRKGRQSIVRVWEWGIVDSFQG